MNLKKRCIGLFFIIIFIGGIVSCSFKINEINELMLVTDISKDIFYSDIVRQGYMGGSLIYNESNKALGQLSDGVSVAIRLSKAKRHDVSNVESVFQEEDGSAIYGLLVIDKINSDSISLKSTLYDIMGNIYNKPQI